MPNLTTLSDAELGQVYEFTCALSATLYAQGKDDSEAEARCDLIAAELQRRGIL